MAKETILRTDGGKLFDLTKESKLTYGQGKELCRMRECGLITLCMIMYITLMMSFLIDILQN